MGQAEIAFPAGHILTSLIAVSFPTISDKTGEPEKGVLMTLPDRPSKVHVTLSTNLHLRAFSFDSQDLEIYVHPFTGQVDRIVLDPDPESTGLSRAHHAALPL